MGVDNRTALLFNGFAKKQIYILCIYIFLGGGARRRATAVAPRAVRRPQKKKNRCTSTVVRVEGLREKKTVHPCVCHASS